MRLENIINWFTFRDYDLEKDKATARIVSRQSRGSIAAQNGWYMSAERLSVQSHKADEDMAFLKKTISN